MILWRYRDSSSKDFATSREIHDSSSYRCTWIAAGLGSPGFPSEMPSYILPGPAAVITSMHDNASLLWENTLVTLTEMLLGLVLGVTFGVLLALMLVYFTALRQWLLPLLLITQAIPVFALAPILMLWFGYGLASKVVMTILVIFFPVATCCYDGLRHTHPEWLDLASTMGGNRFAILRHIRWPAAPAGTGFRLESGGCSRSNRSSGR